MLRRATSSIVRRRQLLPVTCKTTTVIFPARYQSTAESLSYASAYDPQIPIEDLPDAPVPQAVKAIYHAPLRREAQYGVPVCDLQIRSFSVKNVEFFADFALRAAYYLKLPAFGPVPLPKRIERWTVPKSNFVHKKAQQNFERVTYSRLVQIKDGAPGVVQLWLAFLRKHEYHGLGMKANVWTFEKLGGGRRMAEKVEETRELGKKEKGVVKKQIRAIKEGFGTSQYPPAYTSKGQGQGLETQRRSKNVNKAEGRVSDMQNLITKVDSNLKSMRKELGAVKSVQHFQQKIRNIIGSAEERYEKSIRRLHFLMGEVHLASGSDANAITRKALILERALISTAWGIDRLNQAVKAELQDNPDVVGNNDRMHDIINAQHRLSKARMILDDVRAEITSTFGPAHLRASKAQDTEEAQEPTESEELVYNDRDDEVPKELQEAKEQESEIEEDVKQNPTESEESVHHDRQDDMPKELREAKEQQDKEKQEEDVTKNPTDSEVLIQSDKEKEVPKELEDAKKQEEEVESPSQEAPPTSSGIPQPVNSNSDASSGHPEDHIPREMEEGQEEVKDFTTSKSEASSGHPEDHLPREMEEGQEEAKPVAVKVQPVTPSPETAHPEPTSSEDAVAADKADVDLSNPEPSDFRLAKEIQIETSLKGSEATENYATSPAEEISRTPQPTESESNVAADSELVPEPTQDTTKEDFRNAKEVQVDEAVKKDE